MKEDIRTTKSSNKLNKFFLNAKKLERHNYKWKQENLRANIVNSTS